MRNKYINLVGFFVGWLIAINLPAKEVVVAVKHKPLTSQILIIDENMRLEAKIAKEVMNRIAMVNDRIVNIFGEEETFTIQTDEQTGQVFLKPTLDNGDKPINLTIISEHGITQDLILMPQQTKAATIILKQAASKAYHQLPDVFPGINRRPSTEDQLIQVMKKAILGQLPVVAIPKQLASPQGQQLLVKFHQCYQSGNWQVLVLQIKNTSADRQILAEQQFFQPGDLALSLANPILAPKAQTLLYVLRIA